MKASKWGLLLVAVAFPLSAWCAVDGLFASDQPSKQSYHAIAPGDQMEAQGAHLVNPRVTPSTKVQTKAKSAIQMGSSAALPAASASLTKVAKAKTMPATTASTANTDVYLSAAALADIKLSKQVSQLTQNQLLFQQKTLQNIQHLAQENQSLNQQIHSLYQEISVLDQHLKPAISTSQQSFAHTFGQRISWLEHQPVRLLLIIVLLSFGFYGLYWFLTSSKSSSQPSSGGRVQGDAVALDEDEEGEYNFMQSEEGMSAQLDLARAYGAMGDHDAARKVLGAIIDNGDACQREEAQRVMLELKLAK